MVIEMGDEGFGPGMPGPWSFYISNRRLHRNAETS